MKCPTCGDGDDQHRLLRQDDGSTGYRCAACGRLYRTLPPDLASMIDRLDELKANADWLANQHAQFSERISDLESQIKAAQGAWPDIAGSAATTISG